MNLKPYIEQLTLEKEAIELAITTIDALHPSSRAVKPRLVGKSSHQWSAASKRKLSLAMKKQWATRKRKAA